VAGGGLVNSGSVLVLQQAGGRRPAATSWSLKLPPTLGACSGRKEAGTAPVQAPPAG